MYEYGPDAFEAQRMVASEVLESPRRRISFLPASIAAWPRRIIVEVGYERGAGRDVHQKSITACVLWALPKGNKKQEKRRFATFTQDLLAMADWLRECGVTHVAMQSTGVYGKPVWNLLEGQVEILLVNAQHIQAVPGRKTDQKDSEWIADLLPHGLRKGSLVPPTPVPEWRDRSRYRVSLAQECNRIANRVQKVLEDAHLELASVATDALGASGRVLLDAMVEGKTDSHESAEMSQGLLRNQRAELPLALEGRGSEQHRLLLKQWMRPLRFPEARMDEVEQEMERRMEPYPDDVKRLCSIPGVERVTAWGAVGRDRLPPGAVSFSGTPGLVGAAVSRPLRERGEAAERQAA